MRIKCLYILSPENLTRDTRALVGDKLLSILREFQRETRPFPAAASLRTLSLMRSWACLSLLFYYLRLFFFIF